MDDADSDEDHSDVHRNFDIVIVSESIINSSIITELEKSGLIYRGVVCHLRE